MRIVSETRAEKHAILNVEFVEKVSSQPIKDPTGKLTSACFEEYIVGKVEVYFHFFNNDMLMDQIENFVRQSMLKCLRSQPEIFLDDKGVVKKLVAVNNDLKESLANAKFNSEVVVGALYFDSLKKKRFVTRSKISNKGVVTEKRVPAEKERVY